MIGILLLACGTPKVIRHAETFEIETLAALARQEDAAEALLLAASEAAKAGDAESCARYAEPALLIQASARIQAERSLYLAGLRDEDPGSSAEPEPVSSVCGGAQ